MVPLAIVKFDSFVSSPFVNHKLPFTLTAPAIEIPAALSIVKSPKPSITEGKEVAVLPVNEILDVVPPVKVPFPKPIVPTISILFAPMSKSPLVKFKLLE